MNRVMLYDLEGKLLPDPNIVYKLSKKLTEYKITIRATSGEELIITDQLTGEEYIAEDLGYPF